jgi:hypothetical protein
MTMAAKVTYTQKGSDPTTIVWPAQGPNHEKFTLVSGTAQVCPGLISYGNGTITYHDGRALPQITAAGSTFIHQK